MTHVQLGDVARIHSKTLNPAKQTETVFEVFSIPAFDDGQSPEVLTGAEIRSSKTALPETGVLFSKLNPRINRVWLLPESNNRTRISSTEFVCLVPDEAKLLPEYLAWRLKTPGIEKELPLGTAAATKSRERIRPTDLLSIPIFLPPIEEQRRIVDILNRAASIERLKARASAHLRDFIPALFLKMFGDPIENPMRWPTSALGDLLQLAQYGSSKKADATDDAIPVLRMGNVSYDGYLDCSDLKYVELPDSELDKYLLAKGDLLFNRTNSKELVGKTGMWDGRFTAIAASYFIRLRVEAELADPTYVWAFMNTASMKAKLFDMARGAIGQANINAKELQAITVPVPPLETQRAFAKLVEAAVARSQLSETASGLATDLSRSLLDQLLGGDGATRADPEDDAPDALAV